MYLIQCIYMLTGFRLGVDTRTCIIIIIESMGSPSVGSDSFNIQHSTFVDLAIAVSFSGERVDGYGGG